MTLPKSEHPIHKMTLPSVKKEVNFRPYLVKEEKILLLASESNDEKTHIQALKQVIANCILDENFDVDNMSIFDFHHAFLELRAKSVGEVVELKVICTECEQPNDYSMTISDMFVGIPEDFEYKIQLNEDFGVTMRFPRVGVFDEILKNGKDDPNQDYIMIMECIENIYDQDAVYDPSEETREEQFAWLESLTGDEMKKLGKWTQNLPEVKHQMKFTCTQCGKKNERLIGGLSDFF